MIGELPKFGGHESAPLRSDSNGETARPADKTGRVAGGIFDNIKNFYQNQFKPWVERSWKWIVGVSAAVVAVVTAIAVALFFSKNESRPAVNVDKEDNTGVAAAPVATSKKEKEQATASPAATPKKETGSLATQTKAAPVSTPKKKKIVIQKKPASVSFPKEEKTLSSVQEKANLTPKKRPLSELSKEEDSWREDLLESDDQKDVVISLPELPEQKNEAPQVPVSQSDEKEQMTEITFASPVPSLSTPAKETKVPGKLNMSKLQLTINPKALLPGAAKPISKDLAKELVKDGSKRDDSLIEMQKSKPKMPSKRPPSKFAKKPNRPD